MSDKIDCRHIYLHMDDLGKVSKSSEEVKNSLEKTQQLYDSVTQNYFGKEIKC